MFLFQRSKFRLASGFLAKAKCAGNLIILNFNGYCFTYGIPTSESLIMRKKFFLCCC
jgi:hypothetical protein